MDNENNVYHFISGKEVDTDLIPTSDLTTTNPSGNDDYDVEYLDRVIQFKIDELSQKKMEATYIVLGLQEYDLVCRICAIEHGRPVYPVKILELDIVILPVVSCVEVLPAPNVYWSQNDI